MGSVIEEQTRPSSLWWPYNDSVIGCYFCLYFFVHFQTNFTSHSLPHLSSLCLPLLYSFFYAFYTHKQTTRTQFDWYYWSPNNSSTELLTFWNSPVVVPLHLDPVLEPPPLPPNTPTTQSSRLPRHRAWVGVHPPHKDFWSWKGSSLLPQQDCPDQLPPCNKPCPLILRETCHFQLEQERSSHHPPGSQRHCPIGSL